MSLGFHTVSTRSLFVAGLQIAPVPLDPGATLERFEEQVRGAAALFAELQLVVAPELHLMACPGLLDDDGGHTEQAAVAVPGPLTERTSQCQLSAPMAPSERAKPVMLLMVMSALQACRRSYALGLRPARSDSEAEAHADCSRTAIGEQGSACRFASGSLEQVVRLQRMEARRYGARGWCFWRLPVSRFPLLHGLRWSRAGANSPLM